MQFSSEDLLIVSDCSSGVLLICFLKPYSVFLALLDSVSRAHGMGLQNVVRPASVISIHNLCLNYLRTY